MKLITYPFTATLKVSGTYTAEVDDTFDISAWNIPYEDIRFAINECDVSQYLETEINESNDSTDFNLSDYHVGDITIDKTNVTTKAEAPEDAGTFTR